MKKTPFRIAAERFANSTNFMQGCCDEISLIITNNLMCSTKEEEFFRYYLAPTNHDMYIYRVGGQFWLQSIYETEDDARNDRIIALLICEQIWMEEIEQNKIEKAHQEAQMKLMKEKKNPPK